MVMVTQLSREDFVSDSHGKLSVVLLVTLSDLLIPIGFPLFYCLRLSKLLVFSPFFQILRCSQERLLQCATPDSVARLNSSRLIREASSLWTKYFREQEHSSLANFLAKTLKELKFQLRAQVR